MEITEILTLVLVFLVMIVIGLALIYIYILYKNKNKKDNLTEEKKTENEKTKSAGDYNKQSIYNFMQFDKIEDNMIVQNGGKRYLMVIECDGINYDLMSEVEKTAVEAGFVQFLNTLRNQIQLYIQTNTINISSSIKNYKAKLDETKRELDKKEKELELLMKSSTIDKKEEQDLKFEIKRLKNLYEYGVDIVSNIEKTSQNRNVLRKHYYIIVPYYSEEIANEMLSHDEKQSMIFSELYTRCQALIRALYACEVKGRILTSTDIAELLYVAYNRDESEVYSLDTALKAGYDELYVTAPDVLDKRMQALDREIENKALKLAKETIEEVKNEKQLAIQEKEETFEDLVKQMAKQLLEENKNFIGKDVAEESIKKINNSDTKEEGGVDNEEIKKVKRTRKNGTK